MHFLVRRGMQPEANLRVHRLRDTGAEEVEETAG